ncbi:molybdopterin-containing oxidoreductase family protein [Desmospora activa]|uniref:Anaerobic selenocysteine-containing dehydrogenase n=1 Tax=Desmospora activa DSM 45169 TaxID=1121389 RepID=A0A2T4Z3I9_9BACL|nr:molybdopterin oxidoreductase family protein [Desmospora activa]PTM56453.1 anaerobic selenocysteine-containing dehydrogenase [Desmospora activa DSM 45169]
MKSAVYRSVCPLDCPDTCGLHVTVEGGERVTQVTGDPDHPVTKGAICHKVRHFPERVHHPDRILQPLRRVGRKGEGRFEPISWDEALDEILRQFHDAIDRNGAESILPYSYYGNMGLVNNGSMDRRFFHRLGASRLERTICNTAGNQGFTYTTGIKGALDPEETVHSRYVILWGGDFVSTNMHQMTFLTEARKRGAKIIAIDVRKNRTARWADEFISVYPGTDAALALGLMHVIAEEGWHDQAFIHSYTSGWEAFRERLQEYPPDVVARITGVPEAQIRRLAREYAHSNPTFIRIGNGLQHHDNGGMTVRTIACLPALTGAWRHRGGGALKENGLFTANKDVLERPDLLPDPHVRTFNMIQLGKALLEAKPPVQVLFVYNTNPAAVAPDQARVLKGLQREDLFTVVHELFLTDTARYADLVLPATSHLENMDIYKSYWHLYVQLARPVIPPQGEAWSNYRLFRTLAERMGFTERCFADAPEDIVRQVLDNPANPYMRNLSFAELQQQEIIKLNLSADPLYPNRLSRPEGKIALYSETMAVAGMDPLPAHTPLPEGRDGTGTRDEQFPFMFLSPPNHRFLNTTMANHQFLQRLEKRPSLEIHPADAESLAIANGDRLRVYNRRGNVILYAEVTERVRPGVVVSPGLWWNQSYEGNKGVNQLTPDRTADMGGGAVFFSTSVQIERL